MRIPLENLRVETSCITAALGFKVWCDPRDLAAWNSTSLVSYHGNGERFQIQSGQKRLDSHNTKSIQFSIALSQLTKGSLLMNIFRNWRCHRLWRYQGHPPNLVSRNGHLKTSTAITGLFLFKLDALAKNFTVHLRVLFSQLLYFLSSQPVFS